MSNKFLLLLLIICLATIQIPTSKVPSSVCAITYDNIVLYPADGKSVYAGETFELMAIVPSESTNVTFLMDGVELPNPVADSTGTKYTLMYNTSELSIGNHIFTVNTDSTTKSSNFYFYGYEQEVMFRDFDNITSYPSGSITQIPGLGAGTGPCWTIQSSTSISSDGSADTTDTTGKSLRVTHTKSFSYIHIALKGTQTAWCNNYPTTGINEGTFKVEFDLKMNDNKAVYMHGLGASGFAIANSTGIYGSAYFPLTTDVWGKIKIISDLDDDVIYCYYNDVYVTKITGATNAFGNQNLYNRYGLYLKGDGSNSGSDYSIDNFKITHYSLGIMAEANFDNLNHIDEPYSLTSAFSGGVTANELLGYSDGFVTIADESIDSDGMAICISPNGDTAPSYAFSFEQSDINNGKLIVSKDIKLTDYFDISLERGWGFENVVNLFNSNGTTLGGRLYELNKWYHIDIILDHDNNLCDTYIDYVLDASLGYNGNTLSDENILEFVFHGKADDIISDSIYLDNLAFKWINLPEAYNITTITGGVNRVSVPLTKPYTEINKSDITVLNNDKTIQVNSVSIDGNNLILNLSEPLEYETETIISIAPVAIVGEFVIPQGRQMNIKAIVGEFIPPPLWLKSPVDGSVISPDELILNVQTSGFERTIFYIDDEKVADFEGDGNHEYIPKKVYVGTHTFRVDCFSKGGAVSSEDVKYTVLKTTETILHNKNLNSFTGSTESLSSNTTGFYGFNPNGKASLSLGTGEDGSNAIKIIHTEVNTTNLYLPYLQYSFDSSTNNGATYDVEFDYLASDDGCRVYAIIGGSIKTVLSDDAIGDTAISENKWYKIKLSFDTSNLQLGMYVDNLLSKTISFSYSQELRLGFSSSVTENAYTLIDNLKVTKKMNLPSVLSVAYEKSGQETSIIDRLPTDADKIIYKLSSALTKDVADTYALYCNGTKVDILCELNDNLIVVTPESGLVPNAIYRFEYIAKNMDIAISSSVWTEYGTADVVNMEFISENSHEVIYINQLSEGEMVSASVSIRNNYSFPLPVTVVMVSYKNGMMTAISADSSNIVNPGSTKTFTMPQIEVSENSNIICYIIDSWKNRIPLKIAGSLL